MNRIPRSLRADAIWRLRMLGVLTKRMPWHKRRHIADFLRGNGILLVRQFPALERTPFQGPIFQSFDPRFRADAALFMFGLEP